MPASSTQSAIAAAAVSQVAAVAVPVEYGGNVWMWIAIIVLVATIGAYFIFRKNKTIV